MFYRNNQKPAFTGQKKNKNDTEEFEKLIGVCYEEDNVQKIGYLANIKPTSYTDQNGGELSALLLYFIEPSGQWFKTYYPYEPYFYLLCEEEAVKEVIFYLTKTYESLISKIDHIEKEDLNLVNHLSGKTQKYLKLSYKNIADLVNVRNELQVIVKQNQQNKETYDAYQGWYNPSEIVNERQDLSQHLSKIVDIREYDVPYHIRVSIDNEIRCSFWYQIEVSGPVMTHIEHLKTKLDKAELRVCAFDIETSKAELKFPDAKFDEIMMISYVVDGKGFLITNRTIIGDDVKDFEYSPKPEYDIGKFTIFNEPDERNMLIKFFTHMRETKPFIYTTFNGDYFDWPFIDERSKKYNLRLEEEIGINVNSQGEYTGRFAVHMDCFYWVKRDAYLPQGSHGLKAVTKAKLGYDPVELDPELMVPFAREKPQQLAEYSISDAVATYFLYQKMIHDFIFALCTIIPTNPDEVLRKGSGTLCEDLLMAQAFRCRIIFPNKQQEKFEKFYKGHLIDQDTYIGGHVECLRTGVYRSDIPVKFRLEKSGYQSLIDQVDQVMEFALKTELGVPDITQVTNYKEIREDIIMKLENIKQKCPTIEVEPLIYHVDVAAMYPNIILSNRLQPVAVVNDQVCAGCVFNKDENNCKRNLNWQWKGDYFPLSRKEFESVKMQLVYEEEKDHQNFSAPAFNQGGQTQSQLDALKLKQRVKKYCQNVYKQVHQSKVELRSDTVCMRENSFYVDTVRDFRDRRYDYKNLVKVWVGKLNEAVKEQDALKIEDAKNRMNLFESLQLAHKIILNSFYGYVMRKGARWYSMEMAAMVTHTGGQIIMDSRALFDQIGIPLELDTDGIWTLLPKGFPEHYQFQLLNGKKVGFSFPCTMCNVLIYDKYANKQYQTLVDKDNKIYETRTEMSVFFEIDGPHRAMIIPASKEENKMLKKRYAVFNHAGKMTEVKGFELKRRGELQIIKIFQQEVFEKFLEGKTLQECYDACGEVASRWYDILETQGEYVDDAELIQYIGESRVMSRSLSDYGVQKSTSITCAKRLAELLGSEIIKDKGLNVKFIIAKKPIDAKVAERAIPTVIFESDENVMKKFIRKWLKDSNHTDFNMRSLIDWDYYKERLAGTILKIVTIPAALQKCLNPVPEIKYPDWLHKRLKEHDEKYKQKDMKYFFKNAQQKQNQVQISDLEDMAQNHPNTPLIKQIKSPIQKLQISSSAASQQQQQQKDQQQKVKTKYEKVEDCPCPEEDFTEWLKYQKSSWRKIRKMMKDDKQISKINPNNDKASKGLASFIRNMDDVVLNSNWHILQIDETFELGVMRIWTLTENGQMFQVKLRVPRTIYINSKVASDDKEFKKVNKVLPRGRKLYHLYEWEKSEDLFQEKFHNISYHHLMNHNVEGVYETKVPLMFRAILELGCLVRPKAKMIPKNEQALGRTYKIQELEVKYPGQDSQYLPSNTYERIYLLHSSSQSVSQNSRHMWGIFIEGSKEIQFFVVNPIAGTKKDKQNQNLNLKPVVQQTLVELESDVEYADWDTTQSFYYPELQQALKAIDLKLQEYKQKNKGATIVVIQSDLNPDRLQFMGLPTLINDFPYVKCKQVENDNQYPALDWIRFACKNMVNRFTEMPVWLKDRINYSRYSLIPVCNLEGDAPLFIIDTLYARTLAMNKHLLWYSDTSKPDLGGHEDRDFRIYYQEEIENPEISQKGFYRNYTVEIDLSVLAVNTILQSEFLKEFEEASIVATSSSVQQDEKQGAFTKIQSNGEFDTDLDEFVTCASAFKKMRELVNHWLADLFKDDLYADQLLTQLPRWLSSPTGAKMYDPLLHRLVHKLMKKNFYQLLYHLKQLGCNVIFANFNKIFIHTGRENFDEAESFINFVIQTIKQNPMFSFITLTPSEYWRILLFKDSFNMAGVRESNPGKVASKWDIAMHLPEAIRQNFVLVVGEFILKVYKHNIKIKLDGGTSAQLAQMNLNNEENRIQSLVDTVDDVKKEKDHDYICKLITEYFSQKLFDKVTEIYMRKSLDEINKDQEIGSQDDDDDGVDDQDDGGVEGQEKENEDENADNNYMDEYGGNNKYVKQRRQKEKEKKLKELKKWEFPQNIGSYNNYKNAALEYTKFICNNVFGLDDSFSQQANILKKNLLRIIHMKEFSLDVQQGNEPSLVLVIPDVICEQCQQCKDLDICRDPSLNQQNENNQENDAQNISRGDWTCKNCSHPLNKGQIERRLVELLNRRAVGYQMQDLKCVKCKMIKNSLVSRYCECTGTYTQTLGNQAPEKLKNSNLLNSMTDIKLFVQLMRNFGIYHSMPILRDTAQSLYQLFAV